MKIIAWYFFPSFDILNSNLTILACLRILNRYWVFITRMVHITTKVIDNSLISLLDRVCVIPKILNIANSKLVFPYSQWYINQIIYKQKISTFKILGSLQAIPVHIFWYDNSIWNGNNPDIIYILILFLFTFRVLWNLLLCYTLPILYVFYALSYLLFPLWNYSYVCFVLVSSVQGEVFKTVRLHLG